MLVKYIKSNHKFKDKKIDHFLSIMTNEQNKNIIVTKLKWEIKTLNACTYLPKVAKLERYKNG
jgi:hypothetical protein